jgi:Fur family ferric uptake transcriptional regulator
MTPQRRVILDLLREKRWHPTAVELFRAVRRRLPRVSLGTVYRNLDLLSQAGKIGRVDPPEGPRRFDGFMERHTHARCVSCGNVEDLEYSGPGWTEVLRVVTGGSETTESGFRLTGHRIEFEGTCARCSLEERAGAG